MKKDNKTQQQADKRLRMGPVRAVLAGLTIFLMPQFVAGFAIALWAQYSNVTFDELYQQNTIEINFIFSVLNVIVGLLLVYLLSRGYGGFRALGYKNLNIKKLSLTIPVYLIYFSVLIVAFELIARFNLGVDLDQEQTVGFEGATQTVHMIFTFISLVIIAPIFEETLFRGVLFTNLAPKFGFWPAAIVISGLFALAHLQLNVGIDTFILGIAASWLVWKTHSIYPAILLHMLKNAIAFAIVFIVN